MGEGIASQTNDSGSEATKNPDTESTDENAVERLTPKRHSRLIIAVAIMLGATAFIATNWHTMGQRFGYSHDGFNAAVWSIGAQAIETDGFMTSKFGARSGRGEYANHPPAIYLETYLSRRLPIDPHPAARLPAVLSSLLALAAVAALLTELGFSAPATAAGLLIMSTSAMFTVFGSMLDTPVLGLPICAIALLMFVRALNDSRDPAWMAAGIGVLAALTSWTSVVFVVLTCLVSVIHTKRRQLVRTVALPMGLGSAIGLTVTTSWIWWVDGSLSALFNAASTRSGEDVRLSESIGKQIEYIWDAMPVVLVLGLMGVIVALSSQNKRPTILIAGAAVLSYALTFSQGAFVHQYWNFALLIPLSIGIAALIDWALRLAGDRFVYRSVLLGFIGILAAASLVLHSSARDQRSQGFEVASLFNEIDHVGPATGPKLGLAGPTITGAPWAYYETQGRTLDVDLNLQSIEKLSRDHPNLHVLLPALVVAMLSEDGSQLTVTAEAGGLAVVPIQALHQLTEGG